MLDWLDPWGTRNEYPIGPNTIIPKMGSYDGPGGLVLVDQDQDRVLRSLVQYV